MKIKTGQYTLSPHDKLPDKISDPAEFIKKITGKITLNSTASNINSLFPWVNLAEKTLKRYSNFDDALIINLQYNLASVLIDKFDYNKAKKLLENNIRRLLKLKIIDKEKLAGNYRCLAMVLNYLGDYDNALIKIKAAMDISKNHGNYCEYAKILFKSGEVKEAENYYQKVLNIFVNKKGKDVMAAASVYVAYGDFLVSTGRKEKAAKYLNDAYSMLKKKNGDQNFYTIRCLAHISNLLYAEKKYQAAFEKMKAAYYGIGKILGDNNTEVLICKMNCARMIIKIGKYSEALDYLTYPFVLAGKKEIMLLLAYDEKTMEAPELVISKKGSSALKLIKIFESKNIPIVNNYSLAKNITKDCKQFSSILPRYYKSTAKILAKILS